MAATGPQQSLTTMGATELQRMEREREAEVKRLQDADVKARKKALALKKLAREEDEQAQFEENKKREAQKREIDDRIAKKKAIANQYLPNLPQEGLMNKIEYQTQLTPEGMAGAILAEFFVLAIRLLFNTDYMKQTAEYQKLKAEGMLDLIYEPGADGNYPKVYRVDPTTGEIDYDNVVPNGEASHFEIRMNGLVPVPNWTEGLLAACDQYMGDILGQGGLTAEQKVRAYGVLEAADGQVRKNNMMKDKQFIQANQRAPRPTKAGGN